MKQRLGSVAEPSAERGPVQRGECAAVGDALLQQLVGALQKLREERKHERAELQATKQALKSAVALAVREAPTSTKLWDLANALRQSGMIS